MRYYTRPLSGSRIADSGRLDFAIERDYDGEAQVMGMELEGIDVAVLYPTQGLTFIYGFGEEHFAKAALAAQKRQPAAAD